MKSLPKPLESGIERRVCTALKRLGCYAVKFADSGQRGANDRAVLCPNGKVFFLELKRPGGKRSPHQIFYHQILKSLGFTVVTFDNVKDVIEYTKGFIDG